MGRKKQEIVKMIKDMSGRYSPYDIFTDWVAMCALSTVNSITLIHNKVWQAREQQYMDIIRKYTKDEQMKFVYMFNLLAEAFEEEMSDILGEIYIESGCGNKNTGQFFTPFHLSVACTQVGMPHDISEDNPLILNEPSTGGGGMIIAAAKVLKDRGLNYQRCMDVVAQDLDWKGVYMTYVQLSLLGIKATVVQGNTLTEPYSGAWYPQDRIFYTPIKMGIML